MVEIKLFIFEIADRERVILLFFIFCCGCGDLDVFGNVWKLLVFLISIFILFVKGKNLFVFFKFYNWLKNRFIKFFNCSSWN